MRKNEDEYKRDYLMNERINNGGFSQDDDTRCIVEHQTRWNNNSGPNADFLSSWLMIQLGVEV